MKPTAGALSTAASTAQVTYDNAIAGVTFSPTATVASPYEITNFASGSDLTITGATTFLKLSGSEASTAATGTLTEALMYVAGLDKEYVVFTKDSNTYVYGDLGNNNQRDNNDLLVKVVGSVDLDTLVNLLNT